VTNRQFNSLRAAQMAGSWVQPSEAIACALRVSTSYTLIGRIGLDAKGCAAWLGPKPSSCTSGSYSLAGDDPKRE
jgi:hypothetical protein